MGKFFTEKVDIAGGAGGTELTEGTELTDVDGTDVGGGAVRC